MLTPSNRRAGLACPTLALSSNTGGEFPASAPRKRSQRTRSNLFFRCPTHRPCRYAIVQGCLLRGFDMWLAPSLVRYRRFAMTIEEKPCRVQEDFRDTRSEDGTGQPKRNVGHLLAVCHCTVQPRHRLSFRNAKRAVLQKPRDPGPRGCVPSSGRGCV